MLFKNEKNKIGQTPQDGIYVTVRTSVLHVNIFGIEYISRIMNAIQKMKRTKFVGNFVLFNFGLRYFRLKINIH